MKEYWTKILYMKMKHQKRKQKLELNLYFIMIVSCILYWNKKLLSAEGKWNQYILLILSHFTLQTMYFKSSKSVLSEVCRLLLNWLRFCACFLMRGWLINHSDNNMVTILTKFVAGVTTAHHTNFTVVWTLYIFLCVSLFYFYFMYVHRVPCDTVCKHRNGRK